MKAMRVWADFAWGRLGCDVGTGSRERGDVRMVTEKRDIRVHPATERDMPELWALYGEACDDMLGKSYDCEWELGVHPTRDDLLGASSAGDLFMAEAVEMIGAADVAGEPGQDVAQESVLARLLGAYILNDVQTPGYEHASWPVDARPEEVAVIHLLVTSPRARGRGVGRALIAHAVETARERGARVVRLDVFTNNAPALGLYRACGFVDVGPQELVLADGSAHVLELMERDLGAPMCSSRRGQ